MSKSTKNDNEQTQKEFIDYRFTETSKQIKEVNDNVKAINDKLDTSFASRDYVDTRNQDLDKRVTALEKNQDWAVRLIIGSVILAVIGVIIKTRVGL